MTQTNKTRVLFLLEPEEIGNSVLAVFPDQFEEGRTMVVCYSHTHGHSICEIDYYRELKQAEFKDYKPLLDELIAHYGYRLDIMNLPPNTIKCAIGSPSHEGRTFIVYHDGCVKLFDQGINEEPTATVTVWEPEELEGDKLEQITSFDLEEIYELRNALQAP